MSDDHARVLRTVEKSKRDLLLEYLWSKAEAKTS